MPEPPPPEDQNLALLHRRLARERKARRDAEAIAERVTAELYASGLELERLNAQLVGTNEELQSLNQALRDFVAVASHDVRGPLTVILGAAVTLNDPAKYERMTEDQRREFLTLIERQGRHVSRMVEDLLTVSRIEAGALDTRQEVIRLREAFDRIAQDFGTSTEDIHIQAPDVEVVADPDHLQRILANFIGNALKYGRPPVDIDANADGEWVEIRIRDHGDGVPADFVPRLFGKFARGTASKGGTGLGLSIVQGLARANGGDTWYEANIPSGSCFAVRLPRAAA